MAVPFPKSHSHHPRAVSLLDEQAPSEAGCRELGFDAVWGRAEEFGFANCTSPPSVEIKGNRRSSEGIHLSLK